MSVQNQLSGYTSLSPIEQQHVTYTNPTMWIKETIKDGPAVFRSQAGPLIENQLDVVNTCAQEILNSVGIGRAVDAHGELIDYRSQIDQLIDLASDLNTLQQSVRDALKTDRTLTRYSSGFLSKSAAKARLTEECNRSSNLISQMTRAARSLHKEAHEKTKALTDHLLVTVKSLPKDCLEIISQYSIL